jgi:hypothetical protein
MHVGSGYSDEEVKRRHEVRYGKEKAAELHHEQIRNLRKKMADLSEFVKVRAGTRCGEWWRNATKPGFSTRRCPGSGS